MIAVQPNYLLPLFKRGVFGFGCGGKIPAVGQGEFGLKHHAELIGRIEILFRRRPTMVAHIVETVITCQREPANKFGLLCRRTNRFRKNAVVSITAQENRLTIQKKSSAGHLELTHSKTNPPLIQHSATTE